MPVLHRPLVLRVVVVLAVALASVLTVSGPARAIDATVAAEAIAARYAHLGGPGGALGAATNTVGCTWEQDGCFQHFENAQLFWFPDTGVHVVPHGPVGRRFWQERFVTGHPLGDGACGLTDGGCFQNYQRASIFSSNSGGTHAVWGAIRAWWWAHGSETGVAGYPTTEEICGLRGGGCYQGFTRGTVYWSPASGAQLVTGGPIASRWAALRWEAGRLGYPTSGHTCGLRDGGCYQLFQSGAIYSSPAWGAAMVTGAIGQRWAAQGWESGRLGYPRADEVCGLRDGGCYQAFQNGAIYWSPASGAQVVLGGAIGQRWGAHTWEAGRLGYPVTEERCGLRLGGCFQVFQHGSVYWMPLTGAWPVWGTVRDRWAAQGWETGRLGYPVADPVCAPNQWGTHLGGMCEQRFQGGTLDSYHHVP